MNNIINNINYYNNFSDTNESQIKPIAREN